MFVRKELFSGCGNIGDHYHAAKTVDEAIQTGRWRSAAKSRNRSSARMNKPQGNRVHNLGG
jgi:hypothetical protein